MSLTPKNWSSFQHYKDRAPAWIKLHRGLLDDFEFSRLPVASRALAPLLWLLASEYEGGKITASLEELAFRFRMSSDEMRTAITPLIDSGFFDASEPLADCKQEAIPEKKEEKQEKKKEEERENYADEFAILWEGYPNKVGKKDALRSFVKARKSGGDLDPITAGLNRYILEKPPDRSWLNLATFFNGQRWNDLPARQIAVAKPLTEFQRKQQATLDVTERLRNSALAERSSSPPDRFLSGDHSERSGDLCIGTGAHILAIPRASGAGGDRS